jgi:hypothetical protein
LPGDFKVDASKAKHCRVSQVDLAVGVVTSDESLLVEASKVRDKKTYREALSDLLATESNKSAPTGNRVPSPRRLPSDIVTRIDRQVYGKLQRMAIPLEDTVNSVLRRLLGLDQPSEPVNPDAPPAGAQDLA